MNYPQNMRRKNTKKYRKFKDSYYFVFNLILLPAASASLKCTSIAISERVYKIFKRLISTYTISETNFQLYPPTKTGDIFKIRI